MISLSIVGIYFGVMYGINRYVSNVKTVYITEHTLIGKIEPKEQYKDLYCIEIPKKTNLQEFQQNFFNSFVFKMETKILKTIFGVNTKETEFKDGEKYLLWNLNEMNQNESIWNWELKGKKGTSYFAIRNKGNGTNLYFGSTIESKNSGSFIYFHRIYSKILLKSASKKFN